MASCYGRNPFSRNPSENGFLCSPEHSKVCIELLDTFRVTLESLAPVGEQSLLRSRAIVRFIYAYKKPKMRSAVFFINVCDYFDTNFFLYSVGEYPVWCL